MPQVAQATLLVTPTMEGAQQTITDELNNAAEPAGKSAGATAGKSLTESLGESMGKAGKTLTKNVTVPITAAAAASTAAWKEVDAGLDTIVQKTGATGDQLDGMKDVLTDIATTIPVDFETAGAAIGEVNTRFGVTGDALEDLSTQFIKFAAVNNTDVSNSVDTVQKALAAYGLTADDAGMLLDTLTKASQQTGASVDTLASGLVQNATAFEELGLNAQQSVFMMAELETSGANSETVMQGLRKALKNAAKDGVSLDDALADLQDSILNGTDGMDGLTAAYDLFGKSGDQIYSAVKNGTIDFTDLGGAAIDCGGALNDTFEGTLDPMDNFTTTLNELKLIGADLVESAGPMLVDILGGIADGASQLKDAWEGLSPDMQETIIKIAGIAAVAGPLLSIGSKVIGGINTITGGLGSLVGGLGSAGSAAAGAAAPLEAAGGAIGTAAASAIKMIAAAAALWIAAEAMSVLVDAAIRLADAGALAIGVMGGMVVALGGLMGVAALCGPALTAGAVGLVAFGFAAIEVGAGIAVASFGISILVEAIADLVNVVSANAPQLNSIVTSIGDNVSKVVTSISTGISGIIDSLTGGISGILDSIAGIIDSMGQSALNAGTGFEKMATSLESLVKNTGVLDLGATLGAAAKGIGDINTAAANAGDSANKLDALSARMATLGTALVSSQKSILGFDTGMKTMTATLTMLSTIAESSGSAMEEFGSETAGALSVARSEFERMNFASAMKSEMSSATSAARSGLSDLSSMFRNTRLSFEQHIKIPHFSMTGGFNAQTGSTPNVSVNWYAKAAEYGALFSSPTIIGVGDASQPELLIGEQTLKKMLGGNGGVVFNVTVNGAEDPEAWATRFMRQAQQYARI